jgi:predicted aldo/keto reductase-like oxidoreductase
VVLSGMNEEAHVEENLRIADAAYPNSLTEKELELVSRVGKKYRELMKMECTGCGYCLPCPEGVDIPTCFEIYNNKHLFEDKRADLAYNIRLSGVSGKPSKASLCTECGSCEELCPQHLPIPELLKDVAEEFEGNPS